MIATQGVRRHIGEQVRYYTVAYGWMFGTVAEVYPPDGPGSIEMADVSFPPRSSVRGSYAAQTVLLASFLLERCGMWPE